MTKPRIIIVDLDGTLCDIKWRRHFVTPKEGEKKDWGAFYAGIPHDKIRPEVVTIVNTFIEGGMKAVLVSGRSEDHRLATEAWLATHCKFPFEELWMRSHKDNRPDTEVKEEILGKLKQRYEPRVAIDDRPSVIRMWKANDLAVIDVGDGEEF